MAAKIRAQACTTGMSRARHGVDHELADAGIDEHHLDDDDADDEIGEIEGDDGDDRRPGIGQGVAEDDACAARHALELRHLDIGAGEQVDDARRGSSASCGRR